jgi:nitroreductase
MPDGRAYHQFDLGMSTMSLLLAAAHHGLAARPMAGFDTAKARSAFSLGAMDQPMVDIAVGYTSDDESHLPARYKGKASAPRERKTADETIIRL